MDFSKYSGETLDLIRQLEEDQRTLNPDILKHAKRLKKIAEETSDELLLGFVFYRIADANYSLEISYSKFREALGESIVHFMRAGEVEMLARAYNFVGMDAALKGLYDVAYHYYMTALRTCADGDYPYVMSIINSNIAQLYQSLGDYERSRKVYHKAEKLIRNATANQDDIYYVHNLVNDIYGEGIICIILGDAAGAQKNLKRIDTILKRAGTRETEITKIAVMLFRTMTTLLNGDDAAFRVRLKEVLDEAKSFHQIFDFIDDIALFCNFLLERDMLEPVRVILDSIYDRVHESKVIRMQKILTDIEISYHEKKKDEKQIMRFLRRQHELVIKQEQEQAAIYLSSIELINAMEEVRREQLIVRKENEILQVQAMTDTLTGIPNRLAMNKFLEAAFERAYRSRKSVCIEILDIDRFKEYNDTYGHQEGDRCLRRVAGELSMIALEEGVYCARYGGDEFVMIYEDKTDEEVLRYAKTLETRVAALNIKHENSQVAPHVTISQGLCNAVPTKKNKIWDFLTEADNALYEVKVRNQKKKVADSSELKTIPKQFK